MLRTNFNITKPPPYARVDLTHPLGRNCQLVCLFSDGQGTLNKIPGPISGEFKETPSVQYYQTFANLVPYIVAPLTPPVWTVNAAGRALLCDPNVCGMDMGFLYQRECYDIDYPEFAIGATVARGQTVCIIRRKIDTTLRASTLFGVEDGGLADSSRCGAHVPYSDGNVYWDYGGNGAPNRLVVGGLSFTTNVEKWIFTAGPQGSNIWRDGIKVGSQSTPLTRIVPAQFSDFTAWIINGGNHLGFAGDAQEFNFIMYIANQWSDAQCEWWFGEPYAAFYTSFMTRHNFFSEVVAAGGINKTTDISFM